MKLILSEAPACIDERPCFAAKWFGGEKRCRILNETYELDRECPFCKRKAEVTDDIEYPFNDKYGRERT